MITSHILAHKFDQILSFQCLIYPPMHQSVSDLACKSRPKIYAYMPNFIWVGFICHIWE